MKMEFKLNSYNHQVTDEELLADAKQVSDEINGRYLSYIEYKKHGKYAEETFRNHFGSWINVLQRLGLRTTRNNDEFKRIPAESMIADVKRVAALLNKSAVTWEEYRIHGNYSPPSIRDRFGTWENFTSAAGIESTGFIKKIDDTDLFKEIERIWIFLGKQPTTTDMKSGISKYSVDTYARRFGGWRNVLTAFIEFVNSTDSPMNDSLDDEQNVDTQENLNLTEQAASDLSEQFKKRTPRNINLKLRFLVLQRDRFKCCACGASPAKNHGTELHIDHIFPWSKGGETTIDNLQTLCSDCNLGKSNHV